MSSLSLGCGFDLGVGGGEGLGEGASDGLLGGGHDVAVSVDGGGDGFVAEVGLDVVDGDAGGEEPGGAGVAGVVDA